MNHSHTYIALASVLLIGALTGATFQAKHDAYELDFVRWAEGHRIPECPEDAVLIGRGQFNDGTWTRYACGPALDDLGTSTR